MPKPTRAFFALPLDQAARSAANRLAQKLAPCTPGLRWTPSDDVHLTVAFLGDVETVRIPQIAAAAEETLGDVRPFALVWAGLGCFPSPLRPRILWMGVGAGAAETIHLHERLAVAMERFGRAKEPRFTPHATLARTVRSNRNPGDLSKLTADHKDWSAGPSWASEIHLLASELQPRGPTYSLLARIPLGAGPPPE